MSITIGSLIASYKADSSVYKRLKHRVRLDRDRYLTRIDRDYGHYPVTRINARTLTTWYKRWTDGRKFAVGKAFFGQLTAIFNHGFLHLDNSDCLRLCSLVERRRLEGSTPRSVRMTAEHAMAIMAMAHEVGYHSIALAQAFQYELMMRKKDVIGEWTPTAEMIAQGAYVRRDHVWHSGLRWEEIDDEFVLRHETSAREHRVYVDLKRAPMVLEEFIFHAEFLTGKPWDETLRSDLPAKGPLIIYEGSGVPWLAAEYGRKWRSIASLAGVPASVKNMDSRAGAKMTKIAGRAFRDFERRRPGQLPYT